MLFQFDCNTIVTTHGCRVMPFDEPQCYNQNELGSISKENVANVMKIS